MLSSCLEPENLDVYVACRLVTLDKSPGLRPMDIRAIIRRIIGKSVVVCLRQDIMQAT